MHPSYFNWEGIPESIIGRQESEAHVQRLSNLAAPTDHQGANAHVVAYIINQTSVKESRYQHLK